MRSRVRAVSQIPEQKDLNWPCMEPARRTMIPVGERLRKACICFAPCGRNRFWTDQRMVTSSLSLSSINSTQTFRSFTQGPAELERAETRPCSFVHDRSLPTDFAYGSCRSYQLMPAYRCNNKGNVHEMTSRQKPQYAHKIPASRRRRLKITPSSTPHSHQTKRWLSVRCGPTRA